MDCTDGEMTGGLKDDLTSRYCSCQAYEYTYFYSNSIVYPTGSLLSPLPACSDTPRIPITHHMIQCTCKCGEVAELSVKIVGDKFYR